MTATVAELRRAWTATRSGVFAESDATSAPGSVWTPSAGERVLPVVGAHGSAGASTLALAVATVAAPARVVECAPSSLSGLVGAATAELGLVDGWVRGRRDEVIIERWAESAGVLLPLPGEEPTTALDIGVAGHLPAWFVESTASPVVLVSITSLPAIRRIEHVLAQSAAPHVVALRGPRRRRCPRSIQRAVDGLASSTTVVHVPGVAALRFRGVDTAPLPPSLLASAEQILAAVEAAQRKETR